MSLRKSPRLTPQLLAASRQNAQHATGPRSPAAKQNSKLNALKHGERAKPENHYQVMLALGEDPEEFESLKQELMTSFGPGDALWEKQIDDLARLYWRRDRLERAQEGLMRRALLGVEEWQQRRRKEMEGATFDDAKALDISMPFPADPDVRLRQLLSYLEVIREQARQRTFGRRQAAVIEPFYQANKGWRQARLCSLLCRFSDSVKRKTQHDKEMEEFLAQQVGPREQAGEPQYKELLRLLDEEIASVQKQFQFAEEVNEAKAAIERDACLSPGGEEWAMMVRREGALDRSIDRKVKILLSLRKQFATSQPQKPQTLESGHRPQPLESRSAPPGTNGENEPDTAHIEETLEAGIPAEPAYAAKAQESQALESMRDPQTLESRSALPAVGAREETNMNERRGNVIESKGPQWKTSERNRDTMSCGAASHPLHGLGQ